MRILVVGNGAIRIDRQGRYFVNRHAAAFVIDLAARGHQVTLGEPVVRAEWNDGLLDGHLPASQVRAIHFDKRNPATLLHALGTVHRADFVYLFFPGSWSRLFGALCRLLGKPFGIYLRGEQFSDTGVDARVLRAARVVNTVAGLDQRAATHSRHVVRVAPMLETTATDQYAKDFCGRRPDHLLRVLFVGRLEAAKGVPELVEAAGMLHAQGFPFEMRIIGGGPLYGRLSESLSQLGAPPVELTGMISGKAAMMAQYEWADVFVLPTHHEGFPRVLYEAMIKSCVILTTMVGGIPALMVDGRNCLALPLRNPAGIAAAIRRAGGDRTLMQALADAGRATVLEVVERLPSHVEAVEQVLDART